MALIDLDLHPQTKVLRAFGLGALGFFAVLAGLGSEVWGWPQVAWISLLALALLSGLFAIVKPAWNRPLYLIITIAAYPIGLVVSYVALTVIWYLVLTPVGLCFRLVGRDALRRRRPKDAATYWIERSPSAAPERYFRQF